MLRTPCRPPAGLLAVLALLALVPVAPVSAQPPGGAPPAARPAARDTTRFLPLWVHPWLELGGGWMSGPSWLKPHYQSGQGLAAGLEVNPRHALALRTAIDYQMLLAQNQANITYVYGLQPDGTPLMDTVQTTFEGSAWIVSWRGEAGVRVPGDFWLIAGGGVAYMNSGFERLFSGSYGGDVLAYAPTVLRNGWGAQWTTAARWDFQPAPNVPLGLETRFSSLRRGADHVGTWQIRLTYHVPTSPAGGAGRTPRR